MKTICSSNIPPKERVLIALAANATQRIVKAPNAGLCFDYLSIERMRNLNRSFNKKDAPTDVLAFLHEKQKKALTSIKRINAYINVLNSKRLLNRFKIEAKRASFGKFTRLDAIWNDFLIGEIAICPEIARKNAEEYGQEYEREISFLVIHAVLHLFGYDHQNELEESYMRKLQRAALSELWNV